MARFASMLIAGWLLYSGLAVEALGWGPVPLWAVGAVVLLAEIAALRFDLVRWVSFAAGLWLLFAPMVMNYPPGLETLTPLAAGVLLLAFSQQATRPATYDHIPTYLQAIYRYQGQGRPYR